MLRYWHLSYEMALDIIKNILLHQSLEDKIKLLKEIENETKI